MSARCLSVPVIVLNMLFFWSCAEDLPPNEQAAMPPVTAVELTHGDFFGWNAITLKNDVVRLDIIPELGGNIMGYEVLGTQLLWHNPLREGEVDIFHRNDVHEPHMNAGGAKVWPAPQRQWGGPADKVLDGSVYEASVDDGSVTLTSPPDDGEGRTGIQYRLHHTLVPNSTVVKHHLTMTNVVNRPVEWALWHLSTVPAAVNGTVYGATGK